MAKKKIEKCEGCSKGISQAKGTAFYLYPDYDMHPQRGVYVCKKCLEAEYARRVANGEMEIVQHQKKQWESAK